jgi:hypothetical protein
MFVHVCSIYFAAWLHVFPFYFASRKNARASGIRSNLGVCIAAIEAATCPTCFFFYRGVYHP